MEFEERNREFIVYKPMNGALMKKSLNVRGRIFVRVVETSAGGTLIQGMTTDKVNITVELDKPLEKSIDSWVEVLGVPKDLTTFKCDEMHCFHFTTNPEPFDEKSHNFIVSFLDYVNEADLLKYK